MTRLQELVNMSHKYGSNPALVLAGGGNTSYKNEENIYIKEATERLENTLIL